MGKKTWFWTNKYLEVTGRKKINNAQCLAGKNSTLRATRTPWGGVGGSEFNTF